MDLAPQTAADTGLRDAGEPFHSILDAFFDEVTQLLGVHILRGNRNKHNGELRDVELEQRGRIRVVGQACPAGVDARAQVGGGDI